MLVGVWATLNRHDIPTTLPAAAQTVLRRLTWNRAGGRNPPAHWFDSMADAMPKQAVRNDVRALVADAYNFYVSSRGNRVNILNRIKIVSRLVALLPVVAMLLLPLPGHGQQAVRFERAELSIETKSGEVFEFKIELAESGAQKPAA